MKKGYNKTEKESKEITSEDEIDRIVREETLELEVTEFLDKAKRGWGNSLWKNQSWETQYIRNLVEIT